ncbi:hypothetical protein lerEdw1_010181 [Lerista edwardsae]|nr:hypothetical protein lerEdw1_010181 [Lerista edwardsae]
MSSKSGRRTHANSPQSRWEGGERESWPSKRGPLKLRSLRVVPVHRFKLPPWLEHSLISTMTWWLPFLMALVAVPRCAHSAIQLTSSGPGMVRPGENLNLVCTVSGFTINTQFYYYWHWIRQAPGKGLEWVGRVHPYDGCTTYAPALQSCTTISADASKFSLQLRSVTAADSAVYYCARLHSGTSQWVLRTKRGTCF